MTTILFLWTVVAIHGMGTSNYAFDVRNDWRPLGEFASAADCERAATSLRLNPGAYRCISTGKKGQP